MLIWLISWLCNDCKHNKRLMFVLLRLGLKQQRMGKLLLRHNRL
jgi:hypothetical protein